MNAITDAVGTEDIAMPATPATVWAAIQKTNHTRQAAE
jgi:carbon-monoxide dehydrogenase large subunit